MYCSCLVQLVNNNKMQHANYIITQKETGILNQVQFTCLVDIGAMTKKTCTWKQGSEKIEVTNTKVWCILTYKNLTEHVHRISEQI